MASAQKVKGQETCWLAEGTQAYALNDSGTQRQSGGHNPHRATAYSLNLNHVALHFPQEVCRAVCYARLVSFAVIRTSGVLKVCGPTDGPRRGRQTVCILAQVAGLLALMLMYASRP